MLPNPAGRAAPKPAPAPHKRRLMLSVDVEAFEMRSKVAPVDRLIWGRFPEGDYGLERIMSIAEASGARLSTFLDYPEVWAYGDGFLDVGREILRRGHDLNLHLHLDCVPRDYFSKRGLAEGNLNTLDDEAMRALVSDVVELHGRVTSQAPAALRGGGYRYNGSLLRALSSAGVKASSNYNRAAKLQPYDLGPRRQFRWETNTIELPIATQRGFLGRPYEAHFNFNIAPFIQVDTATALANSQVFLDRFYAEHGEDAVAVFVLHSWSFLRMDVGGEFSSVNQAAPERLAALLSAWSKWADIVTATDVVALADSGTLRIDGPLPIPSRMTLDGPEASSISNEAEPSPPLATCSICDTPIKDFIDYNGPKRQCPTCGSTERQRVFAQLYAQSIRPEFDLATKRLLIVAPAASEKRFLKAHGVGWRSIDIRPEAKTDIIGDLCDLSNIADCTFDAVVASFVLTCVHDVDACLAELNRILRPGGRLLTCDPLSFGKPTVEYTDLARITSWYGKEAYDKYRIGSFRTFGDADLPRLIQKHGFAVTPLHGFDAATQSTWVWFMSAKDQSRDTTLAEPTLADVGAFDEPTRVPRGTLPGQVEVEGLKLRVAALEREVQRHRQVTTYLEAEVERAQNTLSFRLGYLLIHAPKSWAALRRLPGDLLALSRDAKRRRTGQRARGARNSAYGANDGSFGGSASAVELAEAAERVFLADGVAPAIALIDGSRASEHDRAFALTRLAKSTRASDPANAMALAQLAYDLEPLPFRAKWLAFAKFNCGELTNAATLLMTLPADFVLKPAEQERVAEINGLAAARGRMPRVPERAARPAYQPVAKRCLYVTASALPFHVSGYTVRTHALIQAIGTSGFEVVPALRPGYPADRGIEVANGSHELNGVTYHHLPGPHFRRTPLGSYIEEAAEALIVLARRTRPQLLHAASNHANALPALIAARRLGIPFIYEVRGMWELTAATRNQNWEQTERFALERDLETLVAREADLVFTLTDGLAADLSSRGVLRERIALVPNSVDAMLFAPRERDVELLSRFRLGRDSFTLVYAGSLLEYEGLDDAIRAVALLVEGGIDARFLIAGDGEAREALRQLAVELGVEHRVKLLGRVAPDEVPRLWSIADVAAFPRKPFRVCELVSPLKPLEPMTMGVPVVVSSVAALREMVQDGVTGLVHRADDYRDLAAKLRELHADPAKRLALGSASREAVLRERTWSATGLRVVELYGRLIGESGRGHAGVAIPPEIQSL